MEAMNDQEIRNITRLTDELVADLLETSNPEIVAEAVEDFGSVECVIASLRNEIESAINSVAKERLIAARQAFEEARKVRVNERVDFTFAQKQIEEFMSPESGRHKLTMAARNGQGSSERDMLSAFSDICDLSANVRHVPKFVFGRLPKAEQILRSLGITSPDEIDVEAIAWHLGAKVKYDYLESCDARIIGADNNAVITVDRSASPQRQRFSICHELGHWIYHRRRMLLCQADEIERPGAGSKNVERIADQFASDLLMPKYLFLPIAEKLGRPSLSVVRKLAEGFNTSHTATAIRLVETNQLPLLLVSHGKDGRRWFTRSQTVKSSWFPANDLAPDSLAFAMVYGKTALNSMPPKTVNALNWFGRQDASKFDVIEESFRVSGTEILTLLAFKDPRAFVQFGD